MVTYPLGGKRFVPEHTPHDTRHTWASWHYEVHRHLLRLRDEGGWGTARMVERYAHRRPGLRAEAVRAWWAGDVDLGLGALSAKSVQSAKGDRADYRNDAEESLGFLRGDTGAAVGTGFQPSLAFVRRVSPAE